jgi:signal transduction histidine kinase
VFSIFWIFFFHSIDPVYSTAKTDSLKQVITKMPDCNEKVDILYTIARSLPDKDYIDALAYCDQASKLAEKLEYREAEAEVHYRKALIFSYQDLSDSVFTYLRKYMLLHQADTNLPLIANAYSLYGNQLRYLGNSDSAIFYLKKCLPLFSIAADTINLIRNYNRVGICYKNLSQYYSALFYYHLALELCLATGNENFSGYMLVNIGKMYQKRHDYELAKEYLGRSIEVNTKYNNLRNLALTNTIYGNVANDELELDLALDYYKQAESLYREIESYDSLGMMDLKVNYGEIYHKQGKYRFALKLYMEALGYYERQDYYNGIIISKTNIGAAYIKLNRLAEAEVLLDACLKLTTESKDVHNRVLVYKNLVDLWEKKGNYKRAFEYQTKQVQLKDTIFVLFKEKELADTEHHYQKVEAEAKVLTLENKNLELEKEKVENDLKLQKKNNESNIFLFSGIGSIVVLLLIFAYHKNAHRKNKIIAEQRIKQLEEEKKLLAARSIVVGQEQERKRIAKELHDGLGVLLSTAKMQFTTIKDKSPENKPLIEKARKLLEQAAGDVRKISHNMMPGLLTRYGFYEAVEDLFEKLDDTPGLSARAAISGEQERLPENTEIMLYRIVQEMANNTLKHAGATEVLIDIVKLPTQLSIDYSDNGKGFDVEQMMVNESIGLSSIQSRVNFLNGNFDMQSKPGKGINYHITIPIEDGKEKEV